MESGPRIRVGSLSVRQHGLVLTANKEEAWKKAPSLLAVVVVPLLSVIA